jgi:hypothetical protein
MDIISHGLYGGVAFGRKSKISYWKSFFFGVMPDLLSFGIFFAVTILALISGNGSGFHAGPPDHASIPAYVHTLYNITHSLVIAGFVIGAVWYMRGAAMVELFAWPLHILVDIPTHSSEFFPTPFLWPISDFHIDGMSWGTPYIFFPNVALLAVLYLWFFYSKSKHTNKK